jgi:uncharacterized protein (TIGR02996 family)
MTAQIADRIVFRGERRMLFSNPLQSYPWPPPGRPRFHWTSTANYRGYVATWEVKGDELFLIDIDANLQVKNDEGHCRRVGMADLFPTGGEPLAATWFSGVLRLPDGERVRYVHAGYASSYEHDLLLAVVEGRVVLAVRADGQTGAPVEVACGPRPAGWDEDEWAFLRALREAGPEDDGPALVYADWLDERGQTIRAAFLRRFGRPRYTGPQAPRWDDLPEEWRDPAGEVWLTLAGYHFGARY